MGSTMEMNKFEQCPKKESDNQSHKSQHESPQAKQVHVTQVLLSSKIALVGKEVSPAIRDQSCPSVAVIGPCKSRNRIEMCNPV